MTDKNLTPQESLQLIEQMALRTRQRIESEVGVHFVIWGYTSILACLLVFLLYPTLGVQANWLWLVNPLLGYPIMLWYLRRRTKDSYAESHVDRFVSILWITLGINAMLYSACVPGVYILPMILILISMGTIITGFSQRIQVLQWSGCLGALIGYSLLLFDLTGGTSLLVFALGFLVLCVIPGHILIHRPRQTTRPHAD